MNIITLSGNLCQDTELRYSVSGKPILNNTLAVRKDKKSENGSYETDFINIVAFDNNAEFIHKYANKGDRILINGKLRNDRYQDKEGNYKTSQYVVVDKIELINSKPKNDFKTTGKVTILPDDLPF